MASSSESAELTVYLKEDSGRDLLAAFPLVKSHIESATALGILRSSTRHIVNLEQDLKRTIAVVAFGSLGRFEFVRAVSDLDPLVIVDGAITESEREKIRAAVLTPLAKANPWLIFDDGDRVASGDWLNVQNAELRYPVITATELYSDKHKLMGQRRWQILLEGRPIYNSKFFYSVHKMLLPLAGVAGSEPDDGDGPPINVQRLIADATSFYAGFDNPAFMYKSQYKYWKTRFLRDFFTFSTQTLFVLGWYLQKTSGTPLDPQFIRAATTVKIMRLVRFAVELEREAMQNPSNGTEYANKIKDILKACDVRKRNVRLFGAHYRSPAGQLLHGLLLSVLARFSDCWEKLYDPRTRTVLEGLSKDLNFESRFEQELPDTEAREVVGDLLDLRDSYRRYMAAAARSLRVFVRGRLWVKGNTPPWLSDAFKPFEKLVQG